MKEFLSMQGLITLVNNLKAYFVTAAQVDKKIEESGFVISEELDEAISTLYLDADTLTGKKPEELSVLSATKLATAVKIGNASFDGSTSISLEDIGLSRITEDDISALFTQPTE